MKKYTALLAAIAAPILYLAPAHGGAPPPAPTTLEGLNGLVNVLERDWGGSTEYAIDILDENSGLVIDFIAISNNTPGGIFDSETGFDNANGGLVLSSLDWNNSFGGYGSFESLFGTDIGVSVWNNWTLDADGFPEEEYAFWLNAPRASQFVVAYQGGIIDQSFQGSGGTNGVPDGGTTYLMLGAGLLGLAAIRRRIGRS